MAFYGEGGEITSWAQSDTEQMYCGYYDEMHVHYHRQIEGEKMIN